MRLRYVSLPQMDLLRITPLQPRDRPFCATSVPVATPTGTDLFAVRRLQSSDSFVPLTSIHESAAGISIGQLQEIACFAVRYRNP